MRYFYAVIYRIIALMVLLLGALFFLLYTTLGANTLINAARVVLPGQLHVKHLTGNVIKGLSIDELTYVDGKIEAQLMHGEVTWLLVRSPWDLTLVLRQGQLQYQNQRIEVQGQGQLWPPFALSAVLHSERGHLHIAGDAACYRWNGQLMGGMPIQVVGSLSQLSQLDTTLSMGPNRLTVTGVLPGALQLTALIPEPSTLHPVLNGFTTTLEANGTFHGLKQGQLDIKLAPGRFQSSEMNPIPFQGGTLSIHVTPDALVATGAFRLDDNEQLSLSLQLPQLNWQQVASLTQPMTGQMDFQVKSLDFLEAITPAIQHPHGQLSAQLKAHGALGHPDVEGTLMLKNAGVSLPEIGLGLTAIDATLHSHNQQWDLTGLISEQDGHQLTLRGQGTLSPKWQGSVLLNGDHFPILRTAEYAIQASPQLTMQLNPDALDITGTIVVPSARFKPMTFSNTVNVTGDAVFVQDTQSSWFSALPIMADVRIQLGDDVLIDTQGLHGLLGGALQMKQSPKRPLSAIGELTIREGRYRAYGQNLAIDHGQLLFTGGALSNPNISLRAVRSFNNTAELADSNQLFDFNASNIQPIAFANHVTVGIDVSGYLNSPKIKLFSVPSSLSQADILSMMILGKPASQASQSGGKLLLTAMSAMNLDSGTKGLQLLSQLKDALGFDFDVQSRTPTSNQQASDGTTTFMVGKSLSKRLYLSYNVGVFQENSNTLTLKYLLNRYFSLQVSTNNVGNGLDLLYTASP